MGVGLAVIVIGRFGEIAVVTVLRASVARSAIRLWKLWTGKPSSVCLVVCLWSAAGDRSALATTLERRVSRRDPCRCPQTASVPVAGAYAGLSRSLLKLA